MELPGASALAITWPDWLLVHWVITLGLIVRIVMRRLPIGTSFAWLAVIGSAPMAGSIAYLILGERRLGRRRRDRIRDGARRLREVADCVPQAELGDLGDLEAGIGRHAARVLGLPAARGNELELLPDTDVFFDRLIEDIRGARHFCHLAFYIWQTGGRIDEVIDAVIDAHERGVECRVMADSVGSGAFLQRQARPLRQAGVEVVESLPSHLLNAASRRPDLRNHRKIVAIDGRIAYTGSQNLVDPEHFKVDAGVGQWVDAMVRVVGPAAVTLEHVFTADWNVEADEPHRMEYCPLPPETTPLDGGAAVQVVPSGPGYSSDLIHHVLLELFYSARKELVITTPYFVPDEAMLEALVSACYRGVDVRLIVPERNDSWLVARASNAFLDECLHAGVDVRLFRGGLLHTKSITVDSRTCLFGSVNLDMRSLFLNFELSLLVYDGGFARAVRALQESYSEQSVRAAEVWDRRTLGSRFLDRTVRLVSPLL